MAKAIYRVYRPTTFGQVSGQEHVVRTIQNQFGANSLSHAYLFTGPRGVGKTTTARLIAKLVNCESPQENEPCNTCKFCDDIASGRALDVHEIDAASHTGVDHVRETIIDSVRFAPNTLKKKIYIIDEVHMLSTSAFNALLKTLEEPPEHVLFVLATTEIHKVPETIISRCQRFDFKRIPEDELVARLQIISKEEGVDVDDVVLKEIAKHSTGCARDAESLLGQVLALGEKRIGLDEASLVLPMTQTLLIEEFIGHLFAQQPAEALTTLNTFLEEGIDLRRFVSDMISWLRDRLLESVAGTETTYDAQFLHKAIEAFMEAEQSISDEHIPQLPVELAIIKICGLGFKGQGVASSFPKGSHVEAQVPEKPSVQLVEDVPPPPFIEASIQEESEEQTIETKEVTDQAAEKVFDTVPVISLEEVEKKWPQVYEQIKSCNASLPLLMRSCEVAGIDGGLVELGFEYALHVDTVNQEKNRRAIEDVFEQVLGKRLRVKAIRKKDEVENDETVNNLLQEFGGSVI